VSVRLLQVHGGADFKAATLIDDSVQAAIEKACDLAPLHNPPGLSGIRTAKQLFDVPQVFPSASHFAATLLLGFR
jgi:acetate kinase